MSRIEDTRVSSPIPARAGVGLKPEHYSEILETRPAVGWFEVHAENYMGAGGAPHHYLTAIREHYPLSVHGVGLSIGADAALDLNHLAALKQVCDRYEPSLVSEHLAWSTHDGVYLNDLLPVPYNAETQARVCEHIDQVQETLGRPMLLENPSTYVRFEGSDMSELEFLRGIVERTGCGLLLDVNNVHVSATNHAYDAVAYIDAFPHEHVGEIHLGGHADDEGDDGEPLLIDDHGSAVADIVWGLYAHTISCCGPVPTLIEWDNDVPEWRVLMEEATQADAVLSKPVLRHVAAE
ncbi:MAG: DUF692 domain-containing protein [Hyphomicrobiaceae bacterium]|nr:DUF692 domain-containing protein [Hyphomicrobiaceae bacterium]